MAHIDLKKDAHIFTQAGVTIQNLLNVVQSFEANELEELRDLINVIKDIDTNDDNTDFKQQLINAINNAVMENEVVDTLDKDSTYPPQTTTVRKALNGISDKIAQIVKNVQDEAQERRNNDSSLNTLISTETSERKSDIQSINETLSTKADKTTLYGTGMSTHTITHSLEKSDLIISINASYGNGYVTIDGETVKNKILMDGLTIQSESISATFSAEKGEQGEKYINLLYSTETGKLDLEVTEQPEPGNFAKMDVTYMKATISEMYARRLQFDGLNTLTSLATKNKNSFLEAINELVASDTSINNSVIAIKNQLENTTATGVWHNGTILTHTANVDPVANNDIVSNVGDFYLNSNTFSVYFCVGDNKGNHNWLYIGNLAGSFDYSNYASINSPHFEGIPTAPTPSVSNNSRQVATTEYVRSAIDKYAGDGSENIDELDKIVDDIYCDNKEWTCTKVDRKFPNVTLKDTSTGEIQINCIDFGRFRFSESLPTEISLFSSTSSKEKITTPNKSVLTYVPQSGEKIYINAEYDWSENVLQLSLASNKIDENKQVDWIDSANKRWQFTLGYYVVTLAQDSSKQYSIQSQTYTLLDNGYFYFANASYKMPLSELPTTNHTSILSSISEIYDDVKEVKNNVDNNKNVIGTLIYALHPDITTYSTSAAKDGYYGKLIKSDVDEVFILNNDRQDDMDYPDGVTLSDKLPYDDEVGYILSQDIPALKKAFCKVTKKYVASIDGANGHIEVLLIF